MLFVVTIMMILVAAAATLFQAAPESRRTREAARMVNVYLSSARNRAMETGRPCGVIFRNFGAPGFAMSLDQCEVPPCCAGRTETSTARVRWISGIPALRDFVFATLSDGSIDPGIARCGDLVQFNNQGPYYTITDDNTVDANGYVTGGTGTIKLKIPDGQIVPWQSDPTKASPVPYRIFRAPMKGGAAPLELPAATVVDLQWSGEGSHYMADGSISNFPTDFTVMFSPNGSVETVYYGANRAIVTEPIFLLIGQRERVENAPQFPATPANKSSWANWQDPETGLWVTVNPSTGAIGTEPGAAVNYATAPNAAAGILQARALAREAQGMGGR